jgi:hypothetical protein
VLSAGLAVARGLASLAVAGGLAVAPLGWASLSLAVAGGLAVARGFGVAVAPSCRAGGLAVARVLGSLSLLAAGLQGLAVACWGCRASLSLAVAAGLAVARRYRLGLASLAVLGACPRLEPYTFGGVRARLEGSGARRHVGYLGLCGATVRANAKHPPWWSTDETPTESSRTIQSRTYSIVAYTRDCIFRT